MPRWLSIISYPTRARGIIVNYIVDLWRKRCTTRKSVAFMNATNTVEKKINLRKIKPRKKFILERDSYLWLLRYQCCTWRTDELSRQLQTRQYFSIIIMYPKMTKRSNWILWNMYFNFWQKILDPSLHERSSQLWMQPSRVMDSNPVQVWIFFQVLFSQLPKLRLHSGWPLFYPFRFRQKLASLVLVLNFCSRGQWKIWNRKFLVKSMRRSQKEIRIARQVLWLIVLVKGSSTFSKVCCTDVTRRWQFWKVKVHQVFYSATLGEIIYYQYVVSWTKRAEYR